LLTIIALIACLLVHGRTVSRARLELAARRNTPWLDPQYFGVGLQVARAIGWGRIGPLVALGVVAAGRRPGLGGGGRGGGVRVQRTRARTAKRPKTARTTISARRPDLAY